MNERLGQSQKERLDQRLEEREELALTAALAPLRELEPTTDLRLKNRRQLAAALIAEERRRLSPKLSLWRRKITLPLPLVLALLATLVLLGLLPWLLGWLGGGDPAPVPSGATGMAWGNFEVANASFQEGFGCKEFL